MKKSFAILFREEINQYDFGEGHPFHGKRGEIFLNFLKSKIKTNFPILKAEKVNDEDLNLICDKDYIEFTKNYFSKASKGIFFDKKFHEYHSSDNLPHINSGNIEEAARYIVGQAKLAADLVCQGKFKKVISIGGGLHHAKRNYGEGFCIYNDVAFCAKYLLENYGLKKILILDTDAHCGNGTMEYFYDDEKVLFIDIHQDPTTLYPGTGFPEQIGRGRGEGFTVNIPLPKFAGDLSLKLVFKEIVEPLVKQFSPQIIIRNGGSDPHFSDPLTSLNLTIDGFKVIGKKTREIAKICEGREIDLIASGYNLEVLPMAWSALVLSLLGFEFKEKEKEKIEKESSFILQETKNMIKTVKKYLSRYWRFF